MRHLREVHESEKLQYKKKRYTNVWILKTKMQNANANAKMKT
jgi:hypothetical protein